MDNIELWQWILVAGSSLVLLWIAPWSKTVGEFFQAAKTEGSPTNLFLLTSSLVISWIFAKSITNAANLGASFGITGGLAYATYYVSFLVAGVVIYRMRTKGGFKSIHEFLKGRFGQGAMVLFSLLIGFRLMNEVWSNTMLIGSYFGDMGTWKYYLAILVFTTLTLAYVLKGGLRSSLLTDMIQMVLFGVLLVVVLGVILPKQDYAVGEFLGSGEWSWEGGMGGGLNLMLLALVQVFSYPFHDPVMTDRAFIADPKLTLKAFIWATGIGFLCIVLFSFVGIYAKLNGIEGDAPVMVSRSLGVAMMLIMNLIMVTSAASTLDSTFASVSKLFVFDLKIFPSNWLRNGRLVMVLAAVAGTLPIFFGPEVISATTISGTMVIGLAPVFVFWSRPAPPISFFLSVGCGIAVGLVATLGWIPDSLVFFTGKYGALLSVNLIGTALCFLLYLAPLSLRKNGTH